MGKSSRDGLTCPGVLSLDLYHLATFLFHLIRLNADPFQCRWMPTFRSVWTHGPFARSCWVMFLRFYCERWFDSVSTLSTRVFVNTRRGYSVNTIIQVHCYPHCSARNSWHMPCCGKRVWQCEAKPWVSCHFVLKATLLRLRICFWIIYWVFHSFIIHIIFSSWWRAEHRRCGKAAINATIRWDHVKAWVWNQGDCQH